MKNHGANSTKRNRLYPYHAKRQSHAAFNPSLSSVPSLLQDAVVLNAPDTASSHAGPHVALEAVAVACQVLGCLLVERIAGVRFEKEKLQSDNNGVEVEHRFPVFAQNVQADVALEVDVGVVDLLRALDLWRLVWEILTDVECKVEDAALVHALVGCDAQVEVQDVVGVGEGGCHGAAQ